MFSEAIIEFRITVERASARCYDIGLVGTSCWPIDNRDVMIRTSHWPTDKRAVVIGTSQWPIDTRLL